MTPPTYLMGEDGTLVPEPPAEPARFQLEAHTREHIAALLFLLGWSSSSKLPVYLDGSKAPRTLADATDASALIQRVEAWGPGRQVEVGLPSISEHPVLWAWVESRASERWAHKFKPAPSMVLKMGERSCRRLLLWALESELMVHALIDMNKRIAYRLHAPQKYAEPYQLRVPLPGSVLAVGRKRPVPILVTRLTTQSFTDRQVAGRLKAPPRPFMERLRAGEVTRR